MAKAVAVLGLLCGCDYAFGLDTVPTISAPCGPYTKKTPVPINGVTAPTHFSITPDGTMAMVVGKDANNVARPFALTFDGTSWVPDPRLQNGLADLVGAHIAPPEDLYNGSDATYSTPPVSPALIGWLGHPLQAVRYVFVNGVWSSDVQAGAIGNAEYDVIPGNVVVSPNGSDFRYPIRHVPIALHQAQTSPDELLITANALPKYSLAVLPGRTDPLNNLGLTFDQAVLTDDVQTLVYSARTKPASFDIYATKKATDFEPGSAITMIDTPDHDEVEPWIDSTCSKLYFRQVAVGQSGDPGTIFVAE